VDASRVGEQPLTARLVVAHPDLFTPNDVYVCDRNFLASTWSRRCTAVAPLMAVANLLALGLPRTDAAAAEVDTR
jgi:hypothetical protein